MAQAELENSKPSNVVPLSSRGGERRKILVWVDEEWWGRLVDAAAALERERARRRD